MIYTLTLALNLNTYVCKLEPDLVQFGISQYLGTVLLPHFLLVELQVGRHPWQYLRRPEISCFKSRHQIISPSQFLFYISDIDLFFRSGGFTAVFSCDKPFKNSSRLAPCKFICSATLQFISYLINKTSVGKAYIVAGV